MTLKDFHARVEAVKSSENAGFRRFMDAVDASALGKSVGSVVIYIEDDPDHISLFKTIVAKYSTLKVLPAFTSEDGKRLLEKKQGRVKCVVMDVGLEYGAGDGLALLTWIKNTYPSIPVLVLTSHTELVNIIKSKYPDIEVHIKAQESVEHLVRSIEAAALGA